MNKIAKKQYEDALKRMEALLPVKNGADCYSKIGHAVTVLRWQS